MKEIGCYVTHSGKLPVETETPVFDFGKLYQDGTPIAVHPTNEIFDILG
jgi:hypothetical protein